MFENLLFGFFGFVLGTALGSFTKAIADRSLSSRTFWGRSVCEKCKTVLGWYDMIPLLSFVFLRGRCRYCGKKIGKSYFFAELFVGIITGYLFFVSFGQLFPVADSYKLVVSLFGLFFKGFIAVVLAIITITDIKKTLIPDRVIIPATILGFFLLAGITIYKVSYLYYFLSSSDLGRFLLPPRSDYFFRHALLAAEPLTNGLIMAVVLGLFFFGLIVLTKGRGMGGGDFKLGIFMGLTLNFPGSVLALVFSFLTGSLFGILLLITGRKKLGQTIPFGPFLALGSLIALFWGDKILNWYLSLKI